jgi:hypothetical protein
VRGRPQPLTHSFTATEVSGECGALALARGHLVAHQAEQDRAGQGVTEREQAVCE